MANNNNKPNADDLVSRLVNDIDGDGKSIVTIKPELIEPLIKQKIEALTLDIAVLMLCLTTFKKSSEFVNEYPEIDVVYRHDTFSDPNRIDTISCFLSLEHENRIVHRPANCHGVKGSKKRNFRDGEHITCRLYWNADYEGDIRYIRPDHQNTITPQSYSIESNYSDRTTSVEYSVYTVNIGAGIKCGGSCPGGIDVRRFLTGSEISSGEVALRVQEVLKQKNEEKQKYEALHLKLMTAVIDRING